MFYYAILICLLIFCGRYILLYEIPIQENRIINYYYFYKRKQNNIININSPSISFFNNWSYIGLHNYIIPHDNLIDSTKIIILLQNINKLNNLLWCIKILKPNKLIISHLLRFSILSSNIKITKLLLNNGADPNIELDNKKDLHYKFCLLYKNKKNTKIPLFTDMIIATKNYKIIKLLLESKKVNMDKCNEYYITPMMAAVTTYNIRITNLVRKYDKKNINFHQYYIEENPNLTRNSTKRKLIRLNKTSYNFTKLTNDLNSINYFNGRGLAIKNSCRLNLLQLVILLEPYYNTVVNDGNTYFAYNYYSHINKKKFKNKNKNDLIDIVSYLIKEGISINNHFVYGRNKNTSGHLFDILLDNLSIIELSYNNRNHTNIMTIFKLLFKNNLKVDYSSFKFMDRFIEYDYPQHNKSKNLDTILYYTKNKFYSKHTETDLMTLIKLANTNYLDLDVLSIVKIKLAKIRYDNFINKVKSTRYINTPQINYIKDLLTGKKSRKKFNIICICILFINKIKKKIS